MNQKLILPFIYIFFLSNFIFCQKKTTIPTPKYPELFKSIPSIDSNTPNWAVLLYSSEPNVYVIETEFKKYYQKHPYTKTVHGQNYKHFMRIVYNNNYLQTDGTILLGSENPVSSTNRSFKKQNDSVNWNFIGPFSTYDSTGENKRAYQANVYSLEQSASNPNTMLAGCETGASFISLDKGENWFITADALGLSGSINAVAIDPSNDQIMYLANRNSLYKSSNRGTSWQLIHNTNSLNITDISINTDNGNDILTAGSKGVFRSTNGGNSWTQVVSDKCWDIERKTNDSNTVFISKINTKNNVTEIWKSTNNGISFFPKTKGWFLPTGTKAVGNQGARIGVTEADPNRIYVLLLGSDQSYADDINFLGIYKSTDAGESWSLPYDGDKDGVPDNQPGGPYSNEDWCLSCFGFGNSLTGGGGYDQGFYNASIDVSDTNADNFLVGMLSLFKSNDAGTSFTPWGGYRCDGCEKNLQHPDIQEIEINGNDVWVASDGGIDKYDSEFNYIGAKMDGIDATENWGFGQGWNEDIIVGGRYHNGNAAHRPSYASGNFVRLGGGESPTGYISADSKVAIFSDIGDKVIPKKITDAVTSAPVNVSMHPNEHYYDISKRSELVNDPRYNDVHYIGKDNKLWKTKDAGVTYTLLKEFGSNTNNLVQGIEIPRDNPDYIYVTQYLPNQKNKIWKSIDGGIQWNELSIPNNNNGNYILIQVSESDKNEVYIAFSNDWDDPNKIFKSINGGNTWTNITTNTLNRSIRHIIFQNGTNGGIYAVTHKTIYYRNNQMADWVTHDNGLPTYKNFNKLLPFYRDGKLRAATFNRGFVETTLFEASKPIAQPLANTEYRHCSKDTVYFDDHSVLKHINAKWDWKFPGASYVSSNSVRNPKVLYNVPGNYDVSLSVTDSDGKTSSKTINSMIKFPEDLCKKGVENGQALSLIKNTPNYLYTKDIELDSITHFTLTAWIKPSKASQSDYACIFYAQNENKKTCSLNFKSDNNHLGIHWNNQEWNWESGLEVPKNKWSYVAMVVTPNDITLHLNEKKVIHEFSSEPTSLRKAIIGSYNGWSSRNYDGLIDELAIWDRALSEEEVRLKRHLVKDTSDPNLQAYYQFNSIVKGEVYSNINSKNLIVRNKLSLKTSTAPVATGFSEKINIHSEGSYNFNKPCVNLKLSEGSFNARDIYVTKLNGLPNDHEFSNELSNNYWIVNNYGNEEELEKIENIQFSNINNVSTEKDPINFKLYNRDANSDSSEDWSGNFSVASSFDTSASTLDFNDTDIKFSGQFFILNKNTPLLQEELALEEISTPIDSTLEKTDSIDKEISKELETPIVENVIIAEKKQFANKPYVNDHEVFFPTLEESFHITVYSITGKEVLKQKVENNHFSMRPFSSAIYLYWIETDNQLLSGKFLIN